MNRNGPSPDIILHRSVTLAKASRIFDLTAYINQFPKYSDARLQRIIFIAASAGDAVEKLSVSDDNETLTAAALANRCTKDDLLCLVRLCRLGYEMARDEMMATNDVKRYREMFCNGSADVQAPAGAGAGADGSTLAVMSTGHGVFAGATRKEDAARETTMSKQSAMRHFKFHRIEGDEEWLKRVQRDISNRTVNSSRPNESTVDSQKSAIKMLDHSVQPIANEKKKFIAPKKTSDFKDRKQGIDKVSAAGVKPVEESSRKEGSMPKHSSSRNAINNGANLSPRTSLDIKKKIEARREDLDLTNPKLNNVFIEIGGRQESHETSKIEKKIFHDRKEKSRKIDSVNVAEGTAKKIGETAEDQASSGQQERNSRIIQLMKPRIQIPTYANNPTNQSQVQGDIVAKLSIAQPSSLTNAKSILINQEKDIKQHSKEDGIEVGPKRSLVASGEQLSSSHIAKRSKPQKAENIIGKVENTLSVLPRGTSLSSSKPHLDSTRSIETKSPSIPKSLIIPENVSTPNKARKSTLLNGTVHQSSGTSKSNPPDDSLLRPYGVLIGRISRKSYPVKVKVRSSSKKSIQQNSNMQKSDVKLCKKTVVVPKKSIQQDSNIQKLDVKLSKETVVETTFSCASKKRRIHTRSRLTIITHSVNNVVMAVSDEIKWAVGNFEKLSSEDAEVSDNLYNHLQALSHFAHETIIQHFISSVDASSDDSEDAAQFGDRYLARLTTGTLLMLREVIVLNEIVFRNKLHPEANTSGTTNVEKYWSAEISATGKSAQT